MEDIYNLTDLPKLETKSDPVEFRKFYDQSSGFSAGETKNHFVFRVSDINSYWLLNHGYLLFQFEITQGAAGDRATCEYLGNHFDRCLLRLGDTLVEDKNKYAWVDNGLEAIGWSRQYAETIGSMSLYHPESLDTSGDRAINLSKALYYITDPLDAAVTTVGQLKAAFTTEPDKFDVPGTFENRNHTLTRGNTTYAMIPLTHLLNFPKFYSKIMRGLDIELELFTSVDAIRLIRSPVKSDGTATSGTASVFKWKGPGISLYLPRVIPTARVQAQLNMQLAKGLNVSCEFEKSSVWKYPVPFSTQQGDWAITTLSSAPTRIYVMVRDADIESNVQKRLYSRSVFLSQVDLYVNGEKIPSETIQAEGAAGSGLLSKNFTQYLRQWHQTQGNFNAPYSGMMSHSNFDALAFDRLSVVAFDLKQAGKEIPDRSSDIMISYKLDVPTGANAGTPPQAALYAVIFSKAVCELQLSEARSVALIR